jgi:hypothetical protein
LNILTDELPEEIIVNGKAYPVNYDFRSCLNVILAFEDLELTGREKNAVMLQCLYREMPDDLQAASEQAVLFLNGGKTGDGDSKDKPRLYSFSKDADFIFAAFRQTHGIDLQSEEMHWYKFLALFMDLGADTTFSNLMGLRKRVKSGKATKEERQAAREMGELFDVPEADTRSLEEREADAEFLRLIGKS